MMIPLNPRNANAKAASKNLFTLLSNALNTGVLPAQAGIQLQ